ncbi:MAG TPA: hypothetical protein VJ781_08470 [Pyrinomonadaceae bacterium]|nr:hypothetical protein [Pyrinomonadaceae bacterium]
MLERKAGTFYYVRCLRTVVSAALVCLLFVAAFAPLANGQACISGLELIADGDFEDGPPWPLWTIQTGDDVFTTPLCNVAGCGTGFGLAGPNSGSNWSWFEHLEGGPNNQTIGQTVTVPFLSIATLSFQLWIGEVDPPALDTLTILVDGNPVATFTEPTVAESGYTERTVDLVLTPGSHTIVFVFDGPDTDTGNTNFSVDDISLEACTVTAATADISGRVVLPNGRGVANTSVNLTDQLGVTLTARTNTFGFYSFDDVRVGPSYVVQPVSSRFTFSPQVITPVDDMGGVNFVAGQ